MIIARRIAIALLWLPIAEIVVFVLVAVALGFWMAVLLTLLASVMGALVLRLAGQTHLRRFRDSPGVVLSADAAGPGLAMVLAGLLLVIPGFITDIAGLLILLPATRRRIAALVSGLMAQAAGRAMNDPQVVDLDPDEWRRQATRQPQADEERRKPPSIGPPRPT